MMDDIENYDNISIAGIQKSLDSVFGAIDFNKYSQYVKLRVNDFCAQNGYIMDQAFDGSHEQRLVVSGDIIGQISLSDPDSGSSCPSLHRISAQSACPDPPGFRLPDTAPSSHMSVQGESPASVLKNAPVSDMQVPQC